MLYALNPMMKTSRLVLIDKRDFGIE